MKTTVLNDPLVTVLIPCYNAEKYVEESVRSILTQTYTSLEIILINDCSEDQTGALLTKLAEEDCRIVLVHNASNLGLVDTLNKGISLAKGKYIARMDADDIAAPERISYQVRAMEENDSVVICGAGIVSIFPNGRLHKRYYACSYEEIKAEAIFNSPFAHPVVIMRRNTLTDNGLWYDNNYKYAEDYHLWQKLLQFGQGINIPRFLLQYRILESGETGKAVKDWDVRFQTISAIQQMALDKLDLILDKDEQYFHFILSLSDLIRQLDFSKYDIPFIKTYFTKLNNHFANTNYCSYTAGMRASSKKYLKIILFNYKRISLGNLILLLCTMNTVYGIIITFKNKLAFK